VCRPCIKEDGIPYGMDIWLIVPGFQIPWVDAFPIVGMACETGAAVDAAVCEREDTCVGFVDPAGVIIAPVPLTGIVCVSFFEFGGLVNVSDELATFDAADV